MSEQDHPDRAEGFDPIAQEASDGFNNEIGLRIVEWRDGFARLALQLRPQHLNRAGGLHGGVTATLIDVAGGYCGVYHAVPGRVRRSVTLSVSVNYIGRATPGTLIECIGERRGGGKQTFMTYCEVRDSTGGLIATGQGVYRHIGEFDAISRG